MERESQEINPTAKREMTDAEAKECLDRVTIEGARELLKEPKYLRVALGQAIFLLCREIRKLELSNTPEQEKGARDGIIYYQKDVNLFRRLLKGESAIELTKEDGDNAGQINHYLGHLSLEQLPDLRELAKEETNKSVEEGRITESEAEAYISPSSIEDGINYDVIGSYIASVKPGSSVDKELNIIKAMALEKAAEIEKELQKEYK